MPLEIKAMLDVLVPGEHQFDFEQFGVRQELLDELSLVDAAFAQHVLELLQEVWQTKDGSLLSPSALRVRLYTMLKELAHPQGANEWLYCAEKAGQILYLAGEALMANAKRLEYGSDNIRLSTLFIRTHATA